jgi:hypothetical protein
MFMDSIKFYWRFNWIYRGFEIWQYIVDWWEPYWPRIFNFEEEKSKIRCLWIQLNFIEDLIEFMEGLIARKIDF